MAKKASEAEGGAGPVAGKTGGVRQRQSKILRLVQTQGYVTIEHLAQRFAVVLAFEAAVFSLARSPTT